MYPQNDACFELFVTLCRLKGGHCRGTQRHLLECLLRARLSVTEDQVLELARYDNIFLEPEDQKRVVSILTGSWRSGRPGGGGDQGG